MSYPYRVELSEAQRAHLRGLVGSGIAPARMLTRARILLKANQGEGGPGWSDAAIAGALDINPARCSASGASACARAWRPLWNASARTASTSGGSMVRRKRS